MCSLFHGSIDIIGIMSDYSICTCLTLSTEESLRKSSIKLEHQRLIRLAESDDPIENFRKFQDQIMYFFDY